METEIYFITGNRSKFKEAELLLAKADVKLLQQDIELSEKKSLSQDEIVIEKAKEAYEKLKKPVLVDDTGIYFDEYGNFPGTYTKHLFKSIGFKGVERLLAGANRNAHFRCLVCYNDGKTLKVFEGVWKGKIVDEVSKRFNPDWQYDSIFVPEGFGRPLSEIPLDERAKSSHRKRAMEGFISFLGVRK